MAELLVSEYHDISLEERVDTACFILGQSNVILFVFMLIRPDAVYIRAKGVQPLINSQNACVSLLSRTFPGRRIRTDMSDGDMGWEENFYILRKSLCPAVLTENFFMDCKTDLAYLQSVEGKRAVVTTHVEDIVEWLERN